MRALCKIKAEPGAELMDMPLPEIRPDEVLLKIHSTAVCGTDIHIYHWAEYARNRIHKFPFIFGHETAGEIIEVGKDVAGYGKGDRVSLETHIACGKCYSCTHGQPHICENMGVFGVTYPGAFAEYARVPAQVLFSLPEDISYDEGAMLEPMGVAVHGIERAEVTGKTVLINGCGPIGLMAVGAAKAHGAAKVIASDLFDHKLKLAEEMGADAVVNSWNADVPALCRDLTHGVGVDVVIDIAGVKASIVSGLRSLHKGGMMVSVGLPDGEIPVDLTEDIIYREITYTGVSGRLIFDTWEDCMNILHTPGFSLKPAMGDLFDLADWEEAFQAIRDGKPGKMILHP